MRSRRHTGLVLVDVLLRFGVEHVFGLPGGQTMALYDGILERAPRIRHVLVRDERTAAYAADAYARLTARVGVCDATVGPGAAKLPSGLGEALNSSIPVLALVSDLPLKWRAYEAFGVASQGLDQAALLEPVTKWIARVEAPEELPALVERAFREATTGRPGPVALLLPQDVLDADAPELDELPAGPGTFPGERVAPDAGAVQAAAAALAGAERPFVLAGGGALIAGAGDAVVALAERLGAAVGTTLSGKGVLSEEHPLAAGAVGSMGTTAAAELLREADAIVLLGTKAGSVATFGFTLPTDAQRVVHVDVEPRLGICVRADARLGAERLAGALAPSNNLLLGGWGVRIDDAVGRWRALRDAERASDSVPIAPQRVIGELEPLLANEDVLVADASLASGWAGVYLEQREQGRRMLFPRGLAGLGYAVPAAIGASIARPNARVVALAGDGALSYAVGELATIVQHDLPVTIVVLNNASLGWIRWYRRIAFGRGHESEDLSRVDFAAVARAYGLNAARVERPDDLAEALALDPPALVDVATGVWETPVLPHREALAGSREASYGS
jgi:acetolactate synthase-1/2/3 large subunit